MKVHVLVEGTSEKVLLDRWAPRAFPGHQFVLHPHQGKGNLPAPSSKQDPTRRGLLDLLPATLRAYAASNDDDQAVLVLVDADDQDCRDLLQRLLGVAERDCPRLRVAFRIAIEETEAFYFGDLQAIKRAFPDADMERARLFVPDSLPSNGTAEEFAEVVGDGTPRKVEWAEKMGSTLTTNPGRSRSPSFKKLHAGIKKLVARVPRPKRARKKHWKTRHPSLRKRH